VSWKTGKVAHKCNIFPTVWAAIYRCKGERVTTWRYGIGHFGRRVPEYACPTCKAAWESTDKLRGQAYADALRAAQDAAGVEDYRECKVRLVAGVPTIVR